MAKQYSDIRLEDILPDSISGIKEIQNTSSAIDPELLSASLCIREALLISRIDELPENVIDLLAWQYHVDMYEPLSLPITQKRAQVKNAVLLHRHKGTPWAIKQSLKNLGFETIKISEWWDLGTLPHTFAIELYPLAEKFMRQAERCINEYKPVRSHMIMLTGRIIFGRTEDALNTEIILPQETMHAAGQTLFCEPYPWPEFVYGDKNTGFKYGLVGDPGVARYGIYPKSERLINTIRNCINEYVFAQHIYGETDLYYNGAVDYGQDAQVTELLYISPNAHSLEQPVIAEGTSLNESFAQTIHVII